MRVLVVDDSMGKTAQWYQIRHAI